MLLHRRRFFVILAAIVALCLSFWTVSRYPDLNQKALLAKRATVADTLSMYPILHASEDDPLWKKVAFTTVNWAHDNRKGMAFGVVLGALFLTLVGYVRLRPAGGRLTRTLYGFLLGSPLGVCVNCAAPVFKGVLAARDAELAFAMMLSSPTMNIVVLTMTFSLFPLYMAVTKVLFTLTVIFAGVPLIARVLGPDHVLRDHRQPALAPAPTACGLPGLGPEPPGAVLRHVLRDFGRNLWFLTRKTVPLMLVAGFLGALVSHLVPLDGLLGQTGAGLTVAMAAVGLALPVPMGFDVVLVNALFVAGLAPGLALVLLCTLGIFSAYSFLIVWQSASRRWAVLIPAGAFVLAVGLGLGGGTLHSLFYLAPNVRDYQALSAKSGPVPQAAAAAPAASLDAPTAPLRPHTAVFEDDTAQVERYPFAPHGPTTGTFERLEGQQIGLERGFVYGIRDYPDPFWIGRGTAGGDYRNTGWTSVAFGSDEGVFLYENVGGRFVRDDGLPPALKAYRVYAVAFVDWTGSGWLDLFVTTFNHGNFLIRNDHGHWAQELTPIPNGNAVLTVAPAIGSFTGDGTLGVFNGNMALGVITAFQRYGAGRRNTLTLQGPGGQLEERPLDGLDGETMAALASGVTGSGHVDVYAGNDFVVPDHLYLGAPGGPREEAPESLRRTLASPYFSMAVDSGDLNNDLVLDFVATGSTAVAAGVGKGPIDGVAPEVYARGQGSVDDCQQIASPLFRENCLVSRRADHLIPFYRNRNLSITDCERLTDKAALDDCLLSVMWMIVTASTKVDDCAKEFGFDRHIEEVCKIFVRRGAPYAREEFAGDIPQVDAAVAFVGKAGGGFERVAFDHPGGWTWSTKIADLDNDGYQDVFNAEGAIRTGEYGFNVLMHNLEGKGFEQKQFSWHLDNPFPLYSFTLIDIDNDGRLDIVGNSSLGPVQVYRNQVSDAHSVAVAVRQKGGNSRGVNAKIIVTAGDGTRQIRELKAGGGYQSFDDYRAYFGLGKQDSVRSIAVEVDGRKVSVAKELPADALYVVELK